MNYDALAATMERPSRHPLRFVGTYEPPPVRSRVTDIVIGAALGTAFGVFLFQPLAFRARDHIATKYPRVGRVIKGSP